MNPEARRFFLSIGVNLWLGVNLGLWDEGRLVVTSIVHLPRRETLVYCVS